MTAALPLANRTLHEQEGRNAQSLTRLCIDGWYHPLNTAVEIRANSFDGRCSALAVPRLYSLSAGQEA